MSKNKTNLATLKNKIKTKVDKIKKRNNEKVKKLALIAMNYLLYNTRVDTSKAVSNWRLSLNRPTTKVIEPYFPGKKASTATESIDAAYEYALERISKKRPGDKIFITNLVHYLKYIDGNELKREAMELIANDIQRILISIEKDK